MTGQDGGFRAAAARFKAEVEAALTRARRAADEAKAQSAEFRRGSDDLADRARTGRLRPIRRGQLRPTDADARADAEAFRAAHGLPVPDLPDADALNRPPKATAETPRREDEDFSQHTILFDLDAREHPPAVTQPVDQTPVDQTSDESTRPGIDSPARSNAGNGADNDDFSQQRILLDATVESYRPESLPDAVSDRRNRENPS